MWGVCGSQGGRDRLGVGSDVGSMWITGRTYHEYAVMWGVCGSQGVRTGQEWAVMWGVCGLLGGQIRSRL